MRYGGRWAIACLVAFLSACSVHAQPTVLVFPVEGPGGASEAVTSALIAGMRSPGQGLKPLAFDPDSPIVQRAVRENQFLQIDPHEITSPAIADMFAGVIGADLTLMTTLVADAKAGQAKISARLSATRGRASEKYEASAALPAGWPDQVELAAIASFATRLAGPVVAQASLDARRLVQILPVDPDAHFKRAQELMRQGNHADAIVELEMALAADRKNPQYYLASGDAYAAAGDEHGAALQYNRALQIDPDLTAAKVRLGEVYLQLKSPDKAVTALEGVLQREPSNARARLALARAYAAQDKKEQALAQYERLLEDEPGNGEALRFAAKAYDDKEQWGRAVQFYARAMVVAPGDEVLRERLIQLQAKAGRLSDAIAELRKAFDLMDKPAVYEVPQFVAVARVMDRECLDVVRAAATEWEAHLDGKLSSERMEEAFKALHTRSDNLARAAEKIQAPELLSAGHRFRVLAYNMLNQSDFELTRFAATRERWRYERARLLRDGAQSSLQKAHQLEAEAGWPTITEAER